VLHLDPHEYYGDRHASLTVDEMVQWVEEIQASSLPRYAAASYEFPTPEFKSNLNKVARQYALSVFPAILPARGDLIDTLIAEDVAKYVSFRLVDGVSTYQKPSAGEPSGSGKWKRVPAGKDQIFKDSSLSLLDKRRLMKFIMFASAERDAEGWEAEPLLQGRLFEYLSTCNFEKSADSAPAITTGKESQSLLEFLASTFQLPHELADTIAYGIAFCSSPSGEQSNLTV
jgi:RAB protein geranylgeranyltransferase component A